MDRNFRQDKRGAPLIDSLLKEERVFRPLPGMLLTANVKPQELEAARREAAADPLAYWEEAAEELDWFAPWTQVLDDSDPSFPRWFTGASCNIAHNALDRHIDTANKNKLALIWEGEIGDRRKYTYYELYRAVNKFANALISIGLNKGDRVAIFMPSLPETVIAMLACAKIGAIHCLIFGGFSAKVLRERVSEIEAKLVITVDGFYRNGRVVQLKSVVDEALMGAGCECVDSVIVVHRANVDVDMTEARDLWYEELVRRESMHAATEALDAEDPLFILFTSGTTGKPKGVVHTHGGYMVGAHRTMNWIFDVKPTDIFWSPADLSWITAHTYAVYGPLLAGTTTLIYEGHFLFPQADRIWDVVERYGVTILYAAPTLIRMLMRFGSQYPRMHDLGSLRLLGSVGEPLNPEAWVWFHTTIGRGECPIMDTWWQTETGMAMISPTPVSPLKPGSVGKPLPGVKAEVLDRDGNPVPPGKGGFLVLSQPWPSMVRTLWRDPEGLLDAYYSRFPGKFLTGDVARIDDDGYFWIQGRADDVLNVAGHRLSGAEFEAALMSHKAVAEAAVVGVPDKIKGEMAKAFIVPAEGVQPDDELVKDLKNHLRREMGPVAQLKSVEFRAELPKTATGKIVRRALKAQEGGAALDELWGGEE